MALWEKRRKIERQALKMLPIFNEGVRETRIHQRDAGVTRGAFMHLLASNYILPPDLRQDGPTLRKDRQGIGREQHKSSAHT